MNRLAKLQLIGPVSVFLAVFAAEIAAAALARWPSSEMLWQANVEWFHAFQKSNYALSAYESMSYSQLWLIAFPLVTMAYCGIALKRPLLLAIASNLSFVYASFVLYAGYMYEQSWREASLSLMTISSNPDFLICFVLLVASLLSFAVSHLYYIRAVRGGIR
jgi:hypothetical protein